MIEEGLFGHAMDPREARLRLSQLERIELGALTVLPLQ